MKKYFYFLSLLIGVCFLFFFIVFPNGQNNHKKYLLEKPIIKIYGRNSKIKNKLYLRITNQKDWEKIWFEHQICDSSNLGKSEIDFDKYMVLWFFGGEGALSFGYNVQAILEKDDLIIVRVQASPLSFSGFKISSYQPWGLVVMEKSKKVIKIEQDEKEEMDGPPKWKTIFVIPALK